MRHLETAARHAVATCLLAATVQTACAPRASAPACLSLCGTAVIATGADPDALLPGVTENTTGIAISDLLFLKLAEIGPALNTVGELGFEPRLARSWQFTDSVTLVFALDPRAHWQDGPAVTAQDVAFTFSLYNDPVFGASERSSLTHIRSVTARDSLTAVVTFDHPYPEQFYDATFHMRALPRHLLDSIPRNRVRSHPFVRQPIGDGPYRFVRWNAGEALELAADSTFFLGRPGLGRLIWRIVPDPASQVSLLIAGEADILEALVPAENVTRVKATPSLRTVEYGSPAYIYLGFNLRANGAAGRPHPILANRELRRALTLAVDPAAVVSTVLHGLGAVPPGPVSRMQWIWSDSTARPPHDTARAGALLDAMDWRRDRKTGLRMRGGQPLRFALLVPATSRVRNAAAQIVQDQLKQIGVQMDIQKVEFNTWSDRAVKGRFDALIGVWNTDPSPASLLQTWTSAGIGGYNYQHYTNAAVDRLANKAVETKDHVAALALWRETIDSINADPPAIWLASLTQVAGVSARFTDVTIRADQWGANLWRWHVAPDKMIARDIAGTAPPDQRR